MLHLQFTGEDNLTGHVTRYISAAAVFFHGKNKEKDANAIQDALFSPF